MIASLRRRRNKTTLQWVRGRSGHRVNKISDQLANEGARRDAEDVAPLHIEPTLKITGTLLAKMTQGRAHKAIRAKKMGHLESRPTTNCTIEEVEAEAEEAFGKKPTATMI